jgi:hypothetical protein
MALSTSLVTTIGPFGPTVLILLYVQHGHAINLAKASEYTMVWAL